MILFPEWLVQIIIIGSLVATGLGMIILLSLLYRDWKDGNIW